MNGVSSRPQFHYNRGKRLPAGDKGGMQYFYVERKNISAESFEGDAALELQKKGPAARLPCGKTRADDTKRAG